MKRLMVCCALLLLAGCGRDPAPAAHTDTALGHHPLPQRAGLPSEALPGGATTVIDLNPETALHADALSRPAANLPVAQRGLFAVGNSFFTQAWVSAPASVSARDGLGPLHNAVSCQDCHIRDGRGHPPGPEDTVPQAAVVRIAAADGHPHPVYGRQLQTLALPGHAPEARVRLDWVETLRRLPDGSTVPLRTPRLQLDRWSDGEPKTLHAALRVAPSMSGLGLLEAIPEAELLAQENAQPQATPALRGRTHRVRDPHTGREAIGRFGWKAVHPTVESQTMDAFANDLGITSELNPQDACTPAQTRCRNAAQGGQPELEARIAEAVVLYARHLALPARRDHGRQEVRAGSALFERIGCAGCHRPSWRTGASDASPALAHQTIWPYTDLLLHDLGPGLAAEAGEGAASATEWRTAPLWGLSQVPVVGGPKAGYLHDGRARTLSEAILWHGGAAQISADAWAALPATERRLVLRFLASL